MTRNDQSQNHLTLIKSRENKQVIIKIVQNNIGTITRKQGANKHGFDTRKSEFVVCEQQMCRPASAYAQSGQRICHSLSGKYYDFTCYMKNYDILAEKTGLSFTFVRTRFIQASLVKIQGLLKDSYCFQELETYENTDLH